MPFRSSDSALPLTPVAFEILLAVSDGPQHGYAILQQVDQRLKRIMPLRTGTLYRALARLLEDGLIEEATDRPRQEDDRRRRYYRITGHGREIARAEARRLSGQLSLARARHLLSSEDQ
jgi:DNA-binding PadR family transcriptional regulator